MVNNKRNQGQPVKGGSNGCCLRFPMIQLYHWYGWYIEDSFLEISIDIDNPVPQFEQLIGQVKAAVISGALKPGEALPSIRQLASDLDLNNKTVAKAYKLLERDEIIETKGYRGTFVHPK